MKILTTVEINKLNKYVGKVIKNKFIGLIVHIDSVKAEKNGTFTFSCKPLSIGNIKPDKDSYSSIHSLVITFSLNKNVYENMVKIGQQDPSATNAQNNYQ